VCLFVFDSCDFVEPPRLPSEQKGSTKSHEKILAVRLERRAPASKCKLEAITFALQPTDVVIFSFVTS